MLSSEKILFMRDEEDKKSLIIYELNEVPKKIIDYYISIKPNSNLNKLIKSGFYSETTTDDIGKDKSAIENKRRYRDAEGE